MKRASALFTETDINTINQAVAHAERGTQMEIVPVVATQSGRYDRAEDLAGFAAGIGAFVVVWVLFQREDVAAGGWDGLPLALQLPSLVAVLIAGIAVGGILATRIALVRRLFTPHSQMVAEVEAAARRTFFDQRIRHTNARTGLLIFVSLFERQAVILADQAALEALGPEFITEACDGLTRALRVNSPCAALEQTIQSLCDAARAKLPETAAAPHPPDELPNALILSA